MIFDNIKSNGLKIDYCSRGMQFAVFVLHSRRGDNAPTDFFVPNLLLNFYLKHFLNVNLDKFA